MAGELRNNWAFPASGLLLSTHCVKKQSAVVRGGRKGFDGNSDPLGYSGVNSSVKTQAGIPGEIQVNTPQMIYAKEPPPLARALLGDDVYDAVAARAGVEGGLGHKYYEQWRVLPGKGDEAAAIASKSRAYYNAVRRGHGGE